MTTNNRRLTGAGRRAKGKRGELELAHKVNGKRVGYIHGSQTDVVSDFAAYQVKNTVRPPSWPVVVEALADLRREHPDLAAFVAIKYGGRWYCVETLAQHQDDHVGAKDG